MDINTNLFELNKKQVYFFDLDGTVYPGNNLFEGVLELLEVLRRNKKDFYFLSIEFKKT